MSPKKRVSNLGEHSDDVQFSKPAYISDEEWNLPAGFKEDGGIATLAEVISPKVATMNLFTMSSTSQKELVIERIKRQKNYPVLSFLEGNEIDQQAAISEVEKQSPIGKIIEQAEQNAIQIMIDRVKKSSENG